MYGEIQSTDDTFRYDYHGVPDEFRIVIATKDGARLSFVQQRYRLWQEFTYDYAANTVLTGNSWSDYAKAVSLFPAADAADRGTAAHSVRLLGRAQPQSVPLRECRNAACADRRYRMVHGAGYGVLPVFCLCAARACHLDCGGRHLPQNAQERTSVGTSDLLCAVQQTA